MPDILENHLENEDSKIKPGMLQEPRRRIIAKFDIWKKGNMRWEDCV